jgi:hypothetical protein
VEDETSAVAAIKRLPELSREKIRQRFEERFTARRMATDYLSVYRSLAVGTAPHLRLVAGNDSAVRLSASHQMS